MKIKEMTIGAMIIAIIALMSLVPNLGFIYIGAIKVTTVHIVVLVVILSFNNLKLSMIAGLTFGFFSWFNAVTRPFSLFDPFFMNPLISVLPRILFVLFVYYLYQFLLKVIPKNDMLRQYICIALGIIVHALLVLSVLYLFASSVIGVAFIPFIVGILSTNTLAELIVGLLIGPLLIKGIRTITRSGV